MPRHVYVFLNSAFRNLLKCVVTHVLKHVCRRVFRHVMRRVLKQLCRDTAYDRSVLKHVCKHVFGHVCAHVIGHVCTHVIGHVCAHVIRSMFRNVVRHVFGMCSPFAMGSWQRLLQNVNPKTTCSSLNWMIVSISCSGEGPPSMAPLLCTDMCSDMLFRQSVDMCACALDGTEGSQGRKTCVQCAIDI